METEAETRAAISLYHTPWGVGFVKVRTGLLREVGLPGEGQEAGEGTIEPSAGPRRRPCVGR